MQWTHFYHPKYSWTVQRVPEASNSQLLNFKKAFDRDHSESIWRTVKLWYPWQNNKHLQIIVPQQPMLCLNCICPFWHIDIYPFLFLIIMDFTMKKSRSTPQYSIMWTPGRLSGLGFADDIAWISDSSDTMQHMLNDLNGNALKAVLRISCENTKVMSTWTYHRHKSTVRVCSRLLVSGQLYLQSVWSWPWHTFKTGQSCFSLPTSQQPISNTVKFRLYSTIVLSTALHACETSNSAAQIWKSFNAFHRQCIR